MRRKCFAGEFLPGSDGRSCSLLRAVFGQSTREVPLNRVAFGAVEPWDSKENDAAGVFPYGERL